MAVDVFSVPVFLIVFRETLETVIIISVLLAFLKQTLDGPERDHKVYTKLIRQVWLGTGVGFFLCLAIGGAIIGVFYTVGSNKWDSSENAYEGAFALVASLIITVVGAALLRISKMQAKWRIKLAAALEAPVRGGRGSWLRRFAEKYAMFVLPFITVLREGIEAIVFVAGVTFSATAKSVPLPVVVGLIAGGFVGYLIYKFGTSFRVQIPLVICTCLLYLVAAGLFSRSVLAFEMHYWNKALGGGEAAELGNGPGSYDIDKSVWHVNCCSPEFQGGGGWGVFNAILGWTNSATYGSVISYNLYWLVVIAGFVAMRYREVKGHWPLLRSKQPIAQDSNSQQSATEK
ncbi:hypothetical protein VTK73DRAFT_8599 [Phialemonium thermophilum]|uniref:High-affinity iron transporter n=1 Tax=Phialemonium thermophilum TaxID=223376 RepID=A0ABR3XPA9_9PEZI